MVREDLRQSGRAELAEQILSKYGNRVLSGPFEGLQYVAEAVGSSLLPKLLGTYEQELHPAITAAIARKYDVAIDVGAAEGYYAVGLACCCPHLDVYAFDPDPLARRLCRKLARLNDVSRRVFVAGFCSPDQLAATVRGRCLVISDCEGFEDELFDARIVGCLRYVDLIVETHDHLCAGVTERLIDRFSASHRIDRVHARPRVSVPAIASYLEPAQAQLAMDEQRPAAQSWLLMYAAEGSP
jgi:hypothetical protein